MATEVRPASQERMLNAMAGGVGFVGSAAGWYHSCPS
jgi:hypothetical protein